MQELTDIGALFGMGGEGRDFFDKVDDPVRFPVDDGAIEDVAVRGTYFVVLGRIGQTAYAGKLLKSSVDGFGSRLFYLLRLIALLGLDKSVGIDDDTVAVTALVQQSFQGFGNAEPVRLGRIHIREGLHPFLDVFVLTVVVGGNHV